MSLIGSRMMEHLLPDGLAWRALNEKFLTQWVEGASEWSANVKTYADLVWLDIFPGSTRELQAWEYQFGIRDTGQTNEQRRARLAARWSDRLGQGVDDLNKSFADAGFDIWVHEWWVPGSNPTEARNPFDYIDDGTVQFEATLHPFDASSESEERQMGEPIMFLGERTGGAGYLLVNNGYDPAITIPADPGTWPLVMYLGAETFPLHATIPGNRREEFETLALAICPAHLWLGVLVDYA
ncbi:MAG: hypothetical protein DRJ50_13935 [Actinobacteria bacterium]|nr:MAG: hypothetical protein DRJ50_13935 [Actinomycetota bacterium]